MLTLTVDTNETFVLWPEGTVKQKLQKKLSGYLKIINVDRPLFSARFIVRVQPLTRATSAQIQDAILATFEDIGYKDAMIVGVSGTDKAVAPGGLQAITPAIGAGLSDIMKPLIPVALIGLAIILIPRIMPLKR